MVCGTDYARRRVLLLATILLLGPVNSATADEPPVIDPFGPRPAASPDAEAGRIELSDGKVFYGLIYLTRDARLKIYDGRLHRQREIPLRAVARIDCEVKREWMEDEWRFKELTADEKLTTGRQYPAREYLHTITLSDGRKIKGPLAALVYLRPTSSGAAAAGSERTATEPLRFVLHKRDKGKLGADLKSLVYVRCIWLGKDAMEQPPEKAPPRSRMKEH